MLKKPGSVFSISVSTASWICPSSALNGAPLDARASASNDIKPEQIERIRVGTNNHMPTTLLHNDPKNELQAKFSMPFSAAILALRRRAGLGEYTDEVVQAPATIAMMQKVDFYVNAEADAAGFHGLITRIDLLNHLRRRMK